jgi:hypothetical protein
MTFWKNGLIERRARRHKLPAQQVRVKLLL